MECSSYILKCEHNGNYFICNRNAMWFDRLVKVPEYVKWWEIPVDELFFRCIQDSNIWILEEIEHCSNEKLKDQKMLNTRKRVYLKGDPDVNTEKICDIVINEAYRGLKSRMKERMKELTMLERRAHIYRHADDFRDKILNTPELKAMLDLPRYKFPPFEKSGLTNKGLYAYLIVNKNNIMREVIREQMLIEREKLLMESVDDITEMVCEKIDEIYDGLEYPQIGSWDVVRFDKLENLILCLDRCSRPVEYQPLKGKYIEGVVWTKESHHLELFYSKDKDSYSGGSIEINVDEFVKNNIVTLSKIIIVSK